MVPAPLDAPAQKCLTSHRSALKVITGPRPHWFGWCRFRWLALGIWIDRDSALDTARVMELEVGVILGVELMAGDLFNILSILEGVVAMMVC